MNTKSLAYALTVGLIATSLLVPAALGQGNPKLETKVTWAHPHEDAPMEMKGNLRNEMDFEVAYKITGEFVCPQQTEFSVKFDFRASFPQWAGASIEPGDKQAKIFVIPQGVYQNGKDWGGPKDNEPLVLDMAWQDDAKVNWTVNYTVGGSLSASETKWTGTERCYPDFISNFAHGTATMPARRIYEAPPDDPNAGVPCTEDPSQKKCENAGGPVDGGDSPGVDVVLLTVALAALVGVMARRRRNE
jgi:hypothetical protein